VKLYFERIDSFDRLQASVANEESLRSPNLEVQEDKVVTLDDFRRYSELSVIFGIDEWEGSAFVPPYINVDGFDVFGLVNRPGRYPGPILTQSCYSQV
jgi:hypothetical protein